MTKLLKTSLIKRLSVMWDINYNDLSDVINRLGCTTDDIDSAKWAGSIDNGHSDMIAGHNGYWISGPENGGWVRFVTNGDPQVEEWSEDVADSIAVKYDEDINVALSLYKIDDTK